MLTILTMLMIGLLMIHYRDPYPVYHLSVMDICIWIILLNGMRISAISERTDKNARCCVYIFVAKSIQCDMNPTIINDVITSIQSYLTIIKQLILIIIILLYYYQLHLIIFSKRLYYLDAFHIHDSY